jgi:RNA polymerase sigma-70 factor, ECF subfamily
MESLKYVAAASEDLIRRARLGDPAALGQLLEQRRPYLKLLSARYLAGGLQARVDSSDIVQQTCLSVHKRIQDFDTDDPVRFLAWLREIHLQNIKNVLREHVGTHKRTLTREEASVATMILEDRWTSSSPSQRLLDQESAVQLAVALESLSLPQREAIRLRFLEGLPLKETARCMERSEPTVVGLIHRGLVKLKELLQAEPADTCEQGERQ